MVQRETMVADARRPTFRHESNKCHELLGISPVAGDNECMNAKWTIALLAALASTARASVTAYGVTHYADWTQISNAQPATNPTVAPIWYIAFGDLANVTSARVTGPNSFNQNMFRVADGLFYAYDSVSYNSIASYIAAHPVGTYNYQITGGTLAGTTGTLQLPAYNFPSTVPYLTGTSYSSLQMAPAGVPRSIQFNAFTANAGYDIAYTLLYIIDFTKDYLVFSNSGAPGVYIAETIPASLMRSGHRCGYQLQFVVSHTGTGSNFGLKPNYAFISRAAGTFQVKADPGTISGQLTLEARGATNFIPFKVQILDGSGNVLETHTDVSGYSGYYAVNTSLTGTHDVRFIVGKHLSKVVKNVNLNAGQDAINPTLLAGDLDEDNAITVFDYSILSNYFDKSYLDADWTTVGADGYRPIDADVDQDNFVTVVDYSYISSNFDKAGE